MPEEVKGKKFSELAAFSFKEREDLWDFIVKNQKKMLPDLIVVFGRYEKTIEKLEEEKDELRDEINQADATCDDCNHRETWNFLSITRPRKLFCSCCGKRL